MPLSTATNALLFDSAAVVESTLLLRANPFIRPVGEARKDWDLTVEINHFDRNVEEWEEDAKRIETIRAQLAYPRALRSISIRLASDCSDLFWVELCEQLIEHQQCRFDEFGEFKINNGSGTVTFKPSTALLGRTVFELPRSNDELVSAAIRASELVLRRHRSSSKSLDRVEPQDPSISLLENSLSELLDAATVEPEIQRNPWGGLILTFSATTYIVNLISFSQALSQLGSVDVPLIGRFLLSGTEPRFDADPEFIDLLSANTRVFA